MDVVTVLEERRVCVINYALGNVLRYREVR